MKIVIRIFGVIAVLIALTVCGMGASRNFEDAKDASELAGELKEGDQRLAEMKENMKMMSGPEKAEMEEDLKKAEAALKDIPEESTFTTAGVLLILLGLCVVACAVFIFKRSQRAVMVLGATVIVATAAVIQAPHVEATLTSGASNKSIAIVAAVASCVCALLAFANSRTRPKSVAV